MAFFPSLKQNFIAYHSSKVSSHPDCIFEIHQLWQSGFSWVYSNCCCSYSLKPEIVNIGQWSHKMYSNNILNFWESSTILNACTKKSGNLLNAYILDLFIYLMPLNLVCDPWISLSFYKSTIIWQSIEWNMIHNSCSILDIEHSPYYIALGLTQTHKVI